MSTTASRSEPNTLEHRPLNILLVEDDELDVMNVQRAFKKNNISNPLFVAGNGIEALEKLRDGTVPRDRKIILFVARARFSSTSCRSAGRP